MISVNVVSERSNVKQASKYINYFTVFTEIFVDIVHFLWDICGRNCALLIKIWINEPTVIKEQPIYNWTT